MAGERPAGDHGEIPKAHLQRWMHGVATRILKAYFVSPAPRSGLRDMELAAFSTQRVMDFAHELGRHGPPERLADEMAPRSYDKRGR